MTKTKTRNLSINDASPSQTQHPTNAFKNPLSTIFDAQLFRAHADLVTSKLEEYLTDASVRGLALTAPETLLQTAKNIMSNRQATSVTDRDKLTQIIDLYIKTGIQVYSPGAMGRQFSGVMPLAGIMDFMSALLNQPSSFYEAAQLPSVAEKIMADELNRFIGYPPDQFAMVTTSGGSLANLTALLAARNENYPAFWSEGAGAQTLSSRPAVAISEDAHYSIARALGIMGIGTKQTVLLPVNDRRQICLAQVRPTLEAAAERGLNVFCIVASAGSTPVGAFDPIEGLAEIAREKKLWLHVDAAHGGALLVSDRMRHKLQGIHKANSFALDAHKMLFVPAPCSLLFYKDKEKSYGAFSQEASYVFEQEADSYSAFESAQQNFECTKRPLIMNLWVLWALYGKAPFAEKIDYLCQLAQQAYEALASDADFKALHKPEANILCFRYLPAHFDESALPGFQSMIRHRIRAQGTFFISKVDLDGTAALRVVFMNHLTTTDHFLLLLAEIKRTGQALIAECTSKQPSYP